MSTGRDLAIPFLPQELFSCHFVILVFSGNQLPDRGMWFGQRVLFPNNNNNFIHLYDIIVVILNNFLIEFTEQNSIYMIEDFDRPPLRCINVLIKTNNVP